MQGCLLAVEATPTLLSRYPRFLAFSRIFPVFFPYFSGVVEMHSLVNSSLIPRIYGAVADTSHLNDICVTSNETMCRTHTKKVGFIAPPFGKCLPSILQIGPICGLNGTMRCDILNAHKSLSIGLQSSRHTLLLSHHR